MKKDHSILDALNKADEKLYKKRKLLFYEIYEPKNNKIYDLSLCINCYLKDKSKLVVKK